MFVRHQAQAAVLGCVPLAPPVRAGVRVNPSPRTAKDATHLQTFSAPYCWGASPCASEQNQLRASLMRACASEKNRIKKEPVDGFFFDSKSNFRLVKGLHIFQAFPG